MKRKRTNPLRYVFLCAIVFAIALVYIARLVNLQLVSSDNYNYISEYTVERREIIQAQRGEIYDRNGVLLVGNEYYYNILLDYGDIPADAVGFNEAILTVVHAAHRAGEADKLTKSVYPLEHNGSSIAFKEEYLSGGTKRAKLIRLLLDIGYGDARLSDEERRAQAEKITPLELRDLLLKRYKLVDESGAPLYSEDDTLTLLERRYDLDSISFSPTNSYTFAEHASKELIILCAESGKRGITTEKFSERVYYFPGYASHILGRMGKITEETVDKYIELGYSLDETVGVSGAEMIFEEYLRGKNGVKVIVEDEYGNTIDSYVEREAVAGKDIRLTIDINIQIAAEDSLAATIEKIVADAEKKPGELDGEDADSGAVTAISPKTGEVLALASYPTFDISTFSEDLEKLLADTRAPLVNKALNGLYPPGSTFKPATAAASLAEGIITPNTIIVDRGTYTYYPDYQPRCWYYLMYGLAHGPLDVVGALQNSCNIFFYECGRLLTIERLNRYCAGFGLGEPTGIEYPEETGILAGPEHVETSGLGSWGPGDTLQAAIGQSYNTFTPLQLSVYISTLTNGGTRYRAHLLHSVYDYASGECEYSVPSEVVSTMMLSSEVVEEIKFAMKNVNENGSTAKIFDDYPISMGGKTGTAQVSKNASDNGVFVAFAPLEEPQIVVSAVVQHGASGTPIGAVAKSIFDCYFGLDKNEK
ncbi:MAG: hypothetical protein IKM09_00040 [Clostridia bacterium]|nr:hypothetical protein [Clostridia bacterium]